MNRFRFNEKRLRELEKTAERIRKRKIPFDLMRELVDSKRPPDEVLIDLYTFNKNKGG
jgi:hypothetical protein